MNKQLYVTKRDGNRAPLDLERIHRVLTWAVEDLSNLSQEENVHLNDYDLIENDTTPQLSKYLLFETLINKQLALFCHEEQGVLDVINVNIINHSSDLFIRTRNRIFKYVFGLIKLLRVSSKFARAPPITPLK